MALAFQAADSLSSESSRLKAAAGRIARPTADVALKTFTHLWPRLSAARR